MYLGSAAIAEERNQFAELSREAALLISIHGDDADVFAAQKADSLFCAGDAVNGEHWAAIFRLIAQSHRDAVPRRS
jgi:hypothetical protein